MSQCPAKGTSWRHMGHDTIKTCLLGFQPNKTQTNLLSYLDQLGCCSKLGYYTFHIANNKGTDQTAWMHRLVCAFVVRKPQKTGFLASRPISYDHNETDQPAYLCSMIRVFNVCSMGSQGSNASSDGKLKNLTRLLGFTDSV